MLRLLTDENFNGSIVRGLVRRQPEIDLVRVQDIGLSRADDRAVLAWAAHEGRVLLTQAQSQGFQPVAGAVWWGICCRRSGEQIAAGRVT